MLDFVFQPAGQVVRENGAAHPATDDQYFHLSSSFRAYR
jgi:hypothetical protein